MNRARLSYETAGPQERELFRAWQSRSDGAAAGLGGAAGDVRAELMRRNGLLEEQLSILRREHDELQQALLSAAQVQRKLCAPRELRRRQFQIATEIFPVHHISGDFCDVMEQDGAICLTLGDIAGKGLAAGLWFTHLVGLARIHASSFPDPAAAVAAIHHDLCRLPSGLAMTSLFLGRLDLHREELVYCNAGQPPALLLRREGGVEMLREGGMPLGAIPATSFSSGRVLVEPGDALLGYSDGIVECRNGRGEEFGVKRLLAAARNADRSSASRMLFSILGAVQDFAGSRRRDDDLTLMVLRRFGEGTEN